MRQTDTQAAITSKCLRCGHKLRSAPSIAAKYGPVCRAKIRLAAITEAVKGFAAAQVDKARELIADGGLIPTSRPGVFRAVSSKGDGTTYLTAANTCGCPSGLRRLTACTCYHSLAARIFLAAA